MNAFYQSFSQISQDLRDLWARQLVRLSLKTDLVIVVLCVLGLRGCTAQLGHYFFKQNSRSDPNFFVCLVKSHLRETLDLLSFLHKLRDVVTRVDQVCEDLSRVLGLITVSTRVDFLEQLEYNLAFLVCDFLAVAVVGMVHVE